MEAASSMAPVFTPPPPHPPHPIHLPIFMHSCPLFLRVGWAQGLASNQQKTVDVRVALSGPGTMMPSVPGPSCPLLSSPTGMEPAAMWVGGAPGPSPRGTASCPQPRGSLEARSPQPQWASCTADILSAAWGAPGRGTARSHSLGLWGSQMPSGAKVFHSSR